MNTDRKAIMRLLADINPRRPMSASAIARQCSIGRADAGSNLAALQTVGLAAVTLSGTWAITARGRDYRETRMAA